MSKQPASEHDQNSQSDSHIEWWQSIWQFFWEIIKTLALSIRALLFVIVQTPYVLLPSAARTSLQDSYYNKKLKVDLNALVDELGNGSGGLQKHQIMLIKQEWIDQINWTNNRATRERDANELIRWWQIILGVLIPVIASSGIENNSSYVSIAGILVATLTAVYQFRRPEERWRHYRIVTERYLNEFREFIALSSDAYDNEKNHGENFDQFNRRMTEIKREDITKFFGEVVPPSTNKPPEDSKAT